MQLCFRQFMELVEKNPNYLDTLRDELGIDPKNLEKTPDWAASVSLGQFSYNGMMYQIAKIVKKDGEITGAMIKPINVAGSKMVRSYIGSGDKQIRSPESNLDSSLMFIDKDKLNNLLTQGIGMGGTAPATGSLPGM